MTNKIINVEGMSCNHCVQTIRKTLIELVGVKEVSVSLEKKEVSVDFDEKKVETTEIFLKITNAGFEILN